MALRGHSCAVRYAAEPATSVTFVNELKQGTCIKRAHYQRNQGDYDVLFVPVLTIYNNTIENFPLI